MKKKYLILVIFLLLIFLPKTNSKYVLSSDKNLGINTPKFNIIETTNGPLTINDNKKDYLEIKFENKEEKEVKGYIEIDGVKVKDITVPASSEETYKINIDDDLYKRLVECDIYPVKVKYISPYKITRDVTTIKKSSLTIHGRVKCMNLGNDKELGIDYSKVNSETNGEGVYLFDETKSDPNPVYFFRGTHNLNNNLLYAGLCWKIVRTTETGGVRIVYNGTPINGKCTNTTGSDTQIGTSTFNPTYTVKQHVGYMFGDDANPYQNTNDSDIKKYIDNWYKTNIKDKGFESSLDKKSIYCGDRTETKSGNDIIYMQNAKQHQPSTMCPSNDSYGLEAGNRKLTYPVGLLTIDETILAGTNWATVNNTNFYLYTNQYYWLLSPGYWSGSGRVHVVFVRFDGYLRYNFVSSTYGVRPALTLKGELPVLEGDGSKDKPFVMTKVYDTLYNTIKSQSLGNDKELGIDYSKVNSETNGEGVYLFDETKSDPNPVYFFRGTNNLNNNLLYAGLCWKIVRTTETGGVRVVYNGDPVNGKCTGKDIIRTYNFNQDFPQKKHIGYMYGSDSNPYLNINDSEIKKYIDNWYKTNIKDKNFESSLDKKSFYCGDRTEGSSDNNYQYYAGHDRIQTGNPTMKCPVNDSYSVEAGNKKLIYPIALLSVDEVMLAGGQGWKSGDNKDYYLYSFYGYWLLSPTESGSYGSVGVHILDDGAINYSHVNSIIGVRPALTIKGIINILNGDGSLNNPYII